MLGISGIEWEIVECKRRLNQTEAKRGIAVSFLFSSQNASDGSLNELILPPF